METEIYEVPKEFNASKFTEVKNNFNSNLHMTTEIKKDLERFE
jgi:hypothetical protein